jgi:S-adenosyl-L-methionine-dependent methyltransferase
VKKFQIVQTDDGSYSLRNNDHLELMHAQEGAFCETAYIYGEAIDHMLSWNLKRSNIASVGFGLGYCEILLAAKYAKKNELSVSTPSIRLFSCETETDLYNSFMQWLNDTEQNELSFIYEDILNKTCERFEVSPDIAKSQLKKWYESKQWILLQSVEQLLETGEKFNCILYDLFSAKTTEGFWSEDFLSHFLQKAAAKPCVFSTYAANGKLKRALKSVQFEIKKKVGYGIKRESTLALLLSSPDQNIDLG